MGSPDDSYSMPWSVQSWVEGEVATPVSVSASSAVVRDVATMVLSLRASDVCGREFSGRGRGGELADHDAWVSHCLTQSQTLLSVAEVGDMWQTLRAVPRSGPDVMSHKDLTPFNLLIREGGLAGVLDTGGFAPADPALDLVVAWHLLDADRRSEFRELIGSGDDEWRRGAAWALQQALGLVWYYVETNPRMSELGRSTIARIMESPELRH